MLLSRRGAYLLLIPVVLILFGYVLYPSLRVLEASADLDVWRRVFASWQSANVRAIVNSVMISVYTVVGAGIVGSGLALLFYRFDFPLRRVVTVLAALPIALPPLVGVIAFLFLYGESGILPRIVQAAFSLEDVPFSVDGLWGVWLIHVYSMYVYFYLFAAAGLQSVDASTLEASADLGAGGWTTLRRVLLPALRPSLTGAAILVFMISMASFTAPLLFAGTEPFLTLQIYNYKINGSVDVSAALSVLLTGISMLFLFLLEWRSPAPSARAVSKGSGPAPRRVTRGPTRVAAVVVSVLFIGFLLLPIATVVLISFAEEGSWTTQILPARYTVEHYLSLVSDADFFLPIRNSLLLASGTTVLNVVFGVAAAVVIAGTRVRLRWLVRALAALPFAIPGTVVAINLIVAFSTPDTFSFGRALVGSIWILPLAYFIRQIPLVVRSTVASIETFDRSLAEAASDLGASAARVFRTVILPSIRPGIIAGALLTFVAGVGEFVSSILLYVVDNRPISVEIWSQLRIYDFGAAAAYSVFLMLLIGLATLAVRKIAGSETHVEQAF